MNAQEKQDDPAKKALALYEESQKEFNQHWIWQDLGCQPEDFFKALKKHVATLNIPQEEWDHNYNRMKEEQRIRSLEKTNVFNQQNLKKIRCLKV